MAICVPLGHKMINPAQQFLFAVCLECSSHLCLAWGKPLPFRSKSFFMDYVTGKFGDGLVQEYMRNLHIFPLHGIPDLSKPFFHLSLQAASEDWRRFVFSMEKFPHDTFRLVDLDRQNFLRVYDDLRRRAEKCPHCVDLEFTWPILQYIQVPYGTNAEDLDAATAKKIDRVQHFLQSVTTFAPLSSDLVECLHGYCQRLIRQGGGGCRPSDQTAQERVLWSLITKAYAKVRAFVWDKLGDAKGFRRLFRFGNVSSNQYTKEIGSNSRKSYSGNSVSFAKMDTMLAYNQNCEMRKPRKLCGLSAQTQTIG